jgi:dihydroorotase-like cyclic amidohydrolase
MSSIVLICGRVFNGVSDTLSEKMEILVKNNHITSVGKSVERPADAQIIDLSVPLSKHLPVLRVP